MPSCPHNKHNKLIINHLYISVKILTLIHALMPSLHFQDNFLIAYWLSVIYSLFINYSSLIQSRSFQYFFLVKSTIKDLYLHGMTAYDASAKIKNTPVSDVEFHSGRMEVHIHTHKNEHNVCMACTYIRFATKRFYMYPQTFPTL